MNDDDDDDDERKKGKKKRRKTGKEKTSFARKGNYTMRSAREYSTTNERLGYGVTAYRCTHVNESFISDYTSRRTECYKI